MCIISLQDLYYKDYVKHYENLLKKFIVLMQIFVPFIFFLFLMTIVYLKLNFQTITYANLYIFRKKINLYTFLLYHTNFYSYSKKLKEI